MKFIDKNTIKLDKVLNKLDEFVIDFVPLLDKVGIKYVIISGYVAILFGRNRSSEDIDLFIEKISIEKFKRLWDELIKKFECVITDDLEDAYFEYLNKNSAIRFARKNEFVPNIELKFPKVELDSWTLNNKKEIILNGTKIFVSFLELQISYKLFLGTEKDIEDAKYLYDLFKGKLNNEILENFNRKLKVVDMFNKYLK